MKHKHHIIPRHAGGTNDPSNLIELTIEEHAKAHQILWEQHGRKEDELAWKGLAGIIGKEELLKQLFINSGKKGNASMRKKYPNISPNKGKKLSEEIKLKMSLSCKGIKKSQKHRENISKAKSKNWIITKPDGSLIKINNLEKYCIENNLQGCKMSLVASGKRKHHKGYICEKVN